MTTFRSTVFRSLAARSVTGAVALACLVCLAARPAAAQSGFHDPGFAGNGKLTQTVDLVPHGDDLVTDVELEDGETGGPLLLVNAQDAGGDRDCVVLRYDGHGQPLTQFGTNGRAHFTLSPGADLDEDCHALAVRDDGTIIVAGTTYDTLGTPTARLAQLTIDGRLDPSFGVGGRAAFTAVDESSFRDVIFDDLGHVVAVGSWRAAMWPASDTDVLIARFDPAGHLETTFGQNGGWSSTWFDLGQQARGDVGLAVRQSANGELWIGGSAATDTGERLALVHWSSVGDYAGPFHKATYDFGTGAAAGARFAGLDVDSSNRVLLAGTDLSSTLSIGALRVTSSGSVDPTYGTSGVTLWQWLGSSGGGGSVAHAAELDTTDRLIIVGTSDGDRLLAASRFTENGQIDLGYGHGGTFEEPIGGSSGLVFEPSVVIDWGVDRATIAGSFVVSRTSDMDASAVRLLP